MARALDLLPAAAGLVQPILFVNSAQQQNGAAGGTLTINKPSGVQSGDLLVAFICGDNNVSESQDWVLPSGWEVGFREIGSNTGKLIAFKTAGGSEPSSYSFTSTDTNNTYGGDIVAWRNAGFAWASETYASGSAPAAPSVRVPFSGGLVVAFFSNPSNSKTHTTPTGMSALTSNSDATAPSWATFTQEYTTGQSTGTKTSTASSGTSEGVLCVLYPSTDQRIVMPTLVASSSNQLTSAGTGNTVNKPSGTQQGDLIVMVGVCNNNPGGWSDSHGFSEAVDQSGTMGLRVASLVAGASEPSSYTFSTANSVLSIAALFTYRNAVFDVAGSIVTNTGGGTVNPASITPAKDFSRLFHLVGVSLASLDFTWDRKAMQRLLLDNGANAPSSALYGRLCSPDALSASGYNYDPDGTSGSVAGVAFSIKPPSP